ncbi:MAG: hypothetical protein V5A46_01100 [Haloferacaceae archaeon]
MSSDRRRFVLNHLEEASSEVTLDELSTAMAAQENDVEPGDLETQAKKRAYISLYQTHVPRMAEHGIVEYDSETGYVRLTPKAEPLLAHLTDGEGSGRARPELYLLTGAVGIVVLLLSGIVEAVPPSTVAWLLSLAIFSIALVHYVTVRSPRKISD